MEALTKTEGRIEKPFPMKVLAVVLAFSTVLFIGLGWHTWSSYQAFKRIKERDFRLQELAGIIIHLDEVLTMSARMAAATGDLEWEGRYRSFEPKLDATIKETIHLVPEAYQRESAAQTDAANIKLVELENRSFALVRRGQREAASKLLSSQEYEEQKRIYAEGMKDISAAIKERVEINLRSQHRRMLFAVAALTVVLPALIFSWMAGLRIVGRYLNDRRRAEEQNQRHLQRMTVLREINAAITSTLDIRSVLNVLIEKIDLFLPRTSVQVWLLNEEKGFVERTACGNLDEVEWKRREMKCAPPLVQEAFESRMPVTTMNVQTDPRTLDPQFFRRHGLISYLGVPMLVKGEPKGVLVFHTRELHEFAQEEIRFFSILAGQAAMAVHNSQLYERMSNQAGELERANENLVRREEIQNLLKELSQDITTMDLDSLLKKLTEKVREVLKVDVADVRVKEKEDWHLMGISGIEPERLLSGRTGSARGRSGWIRKHRRPLVIPDINKETEISVGETTRRLGIRGYLAVPLFSRGGEVIGVLSALTYEPRQFTQEEVDLLQQMANGAGIALENARLLEQIKSQAEELEKANRAKDEFLSFMSHEIRTPVNAVVGYAGMVRDGIFGEVSVEQGRVLGKILARSRDLLEMINGLLEVTRIEAGAMKVESREVGLNGFLNELRSSYDVPLGKELSLQWDYPPGLPVIRTDSGKLRHILQNLINNAIKYTDRGQVTISARIKEDERLRQRRISLRLKQAEGNGEVEFKVSDTGIGIPKESMPFIFEMFQQGDGSREGRRGGVGLGLYIVKEFTEMLGGKIEVDSEPGKGSTFTVTMPCNASNLRPAVMQQEMER